MADPVDLTYQRPDEAFIALFNSHSNTDYVADDISLQVMSVDDNDPSLARVLATVNGGIFDGQLIVKWTRLDIAEYAARVTDEPLQIEVANLPATCDLLASEIGLALNVNLAESDIVADPIDTTGWTFPTTLTVTMSDGSPLWYGYYEITILEGTPPLPPPWDLSGFTYTP